MPRHRGPSVLAALVAIALAAAPLRAQTAAPAPSAAELAAARQLFGDALRAEDEGRWRDALDTFDRVAKITVSPALRYHVGVCHEHLGELVESLNAFEIAVQEGEEKRALDVVKEARAHAEKIRPQIACIVVNVPPDAADVVITLDGHPVNAVLVGTSMPIDPGTRHVTVRASNYARSYEASLSVVPGESKVVEAALGARAAAPPAAATATVPPVAAPPAPAPRPPEAPAPRRSLAPVLVAGGATAALAVGAVAAGIAAHVDYTQYLVENVSPPTVSLQQREALRSEGIARAWASTAFTVGAAIAGAATIYLLVRLGEPPPGPPGAPPARALVWGPWIGADGAGLSLQGVM